MYQHVLFIVGATASGKTELSLKLADLIGGEIVNLDTGQMYEPLKIGTAKPDWKRCRIRHHLFDIALKPINVSVQEYSKKFLKSARDILSRGKIPIVTGGSLFYLKSLFFPLKNFKDQWNQAIDNQVCVKGSWKDLLKIDPERAKRINPNDEYRINRALSIFELTGLKPSEFEPKFDPEFDSTVLFIDVDKEVLSRRIENRTREMISSGWIDEAERLRDAGWHDFIRQKGFIGYGEIFDWLELDQSEKSHTELISSITRKTRSYAKKQRTFWRSLKTSIETSSSQKGRFCHIDIMDARLTGRILSFVQKRFKNQKKGCGA